MMIKVFTTDRDGKITLTGKELKELLDEAYWEGYRSNNSSWVYKSPSWSPYWYTTTAGNTTITLSNEAKENISCSTDTATNGIKINSCANNTVTNCSVKCGGNSKLTY